MLYSGTPGSGKSLHTARDIRDSLGPKRRPVIANFDVSPLTRGYRERFTYIPNNDLTPEFLMEFATDYWKGRKVREDAILLVIDEAQLVFNSRTWQDRGGSQKRMDWIEFFSQHRHFGYKVVLIAQFDRMIDRQIRSLVEIEVNHRKLANFGLKGLLLSLPFGGKLFCAVSYYYGLKEKVGTTWLLPRRAYFRLYDSYNRFEQASGRAVRGEGQGVPCPAPRAPAAFEGRSVVWTAKYPFRSFERLVSALLGAHAPSGPRQRPYINLIN